MPKPRIAVVSPFIDKRHGTERTVAECLQRLATDFEIHVYSNRVEDVDLETITWHWVPALPGPHLLGYFWWFAANHLWRWSDRWFRGIEPDVTFSPGINCLDADAILVHVVFARFRERMKQQLLFGMNPWKTWPQILHRRIYYWLIATLERRVYPRPEVPIVAVSAKTANDLSCFYARTSNVQIAHIGLDFDRFNPANRAALREGARRSLGLSGDQFVLLLIGNDWKSKGLPCVLEAAGQLGAASLRILVAGTGNPAPFESAIQRHGLAGRVRFLPPRADVEFYYAAADLYVSPTLEDAFALPPVEAMACGLPIITSRNNGGAEIVSSGEDGFILEDPSDFMALSDIVQNLMNNSELRQRVAAKAVSTAQKLTWEDTAELIRASWEQAPRLKRDSSLKK